MNKYTTVETEHEVTLNPTVPAVATVVLLHGLGADGHDFVPIAGELGMPDSLPVIGPASRTADVVYAFGHGHVGMAGGAQTGLLVADLISGRRPRIALEPFSPTRFC